MRYYRHIMLTILLSSLPLLAVAERLDIVYLEQNWSDKDRDYFYFADQGSRLIPYDYFLHLEQADNKQLLRSDNNMLRLGFIPTVSNKNNPDGLPIGLTRNGSHMGPTWAPLARHVILNKSLIKIK